MTFLRTPHIAGLTIVVTIVLALALPRSLGPYYLHVVNITLINVIIALGLNFILGFGGQISLAQSAFFGIGAYTFAVLEGYGVTPFLSAPAAIVASGLLGWALGAPTLRLKGHYLALATLAFALIVGELFISLDTITGGANGIAGITGIGLANDDRAMLYVLGAVTAFAFILSEAFARSPLGLRVRAFRDDPTAALAAGININALKQLLFVISAVYAGIGGIGYVALMGYVSPDLFAWQTTFSYLAMVVVGGLGSSVGAVVGAVLYTLGPEWLRFLQQAYFAFFGLLVVVIMAAFPGGIVGILRSLGRMMMRALRPRDSHDNAAGEVPGRVK
jgi:branched-chain amino acid transport system permease protein